ncbi:MAG: hypothetical protein IPN94_26615 [Sphingobacteriales bacterium]|nr:hypothetical protein [Sphingobacteriales bacterium]MBP6663717.1 hypothetical protein [Chitinophagales bacterium]
MMKQLILLAFVMLFNIISLFASTTKLDAKLVLIGIAIEQNSQTPVHNAVVTLIELNTGVKKQFTTSSDGQFYFKLEADKSYNLILTDENGKKEDIRTISTANKSKPEVLHAILQRTTTKANTVITKNNFAVATQPSYAKEVK